MRKVKRNISSANPKNVGARNIPLQRPAILAKNQGPNASMPELANQMHQHSQEYLIRSANNASGHQQPLPRYSQRQQYATVLSGNLMNVHSAIGSIQNFELNDNVKRTNSNDRDEGGRDKEPSTHDKALQELQSLTFHD